MAVPSGTIPTGQVVDAAGALALHESLPRAIWNRTVEALGVERKTFAGEVFTALEGRRLDLWREQVKKRVNWELFDTGLDTYTWLVLEELARAAEKTRDHDGRRLVDGAPHGTETARLA